MLRRKLPRRPGDPMRVLCLEAHSDDLGAGEIIRGSVEPALKLPLRQNHD